MMPNCEGCGQPLPVDSNPSRRTCSHSCRSRAYYKRREDRARLDAARDLLIRQTRAVISGDANALAAIADEAERLLGV